MPTTPKKKRRRRIPERRVLDANKAELRINEQDGKRRVEGYAAVYNSPSVDLGGFTEVLEPGCFDDCLAAGPDVFALYNHEPDAVLARNTSGTLSLSLDERGLAYSFDMPDTTLGRDLAELMARGDIHGSSFAFISDKAEFRKEGNKSVRYIQKVRELVDVSVVTTPAYPAAGSAIRSFKRWQKSQEIVTEIPEELLAHLAMLRLRAQRTKL